MTAVRLSSAEDEERLGREGIQLEAEAAIHAPLSRGAHRVTPRGGGGFLAGVPAPGETRIEVLRNRHAGFEAEADYLGLQYMYKAGYDPAAFVDFFEKIESLEKKKPGAVAKVFATHPMTDDRITAAQKEMEKDLTPKSEYVQPKRGEEKYCQASGLALKVPVIGR